MKGINPYTSQEIFNYDKLQAINKVAANFCSWVKAMEGYYTVNLIVIPKKALLAEAQAKFEKVSAVLKIAQAKLAEVVKEVN